jgi:hypothetical protein
VTTTVKFLGGFLGVRVRNVTTKNVVILSRDKVWILKGNGKTEVLL